MKYLIDTNLTPAMFNANSVEDRARLGEAFKQAVEVEELEPVKGSAWSEAVKALKSWRPT